MRFSLPKQLQNVYVFSIPLFILHVIEEYVTLYYPTLFGITYRMKNLPQEKFITIETVVITGMMTAFYLLKKKLIPLPLMILPGFFYLYQYEHISHTIKLHSYYPGTFTGIALLLLGLFYWKELLRAFWKRRNLFS